MSRRSSTAGSRGIVVQDDQGREYTTFRPAIGREAAKFEGRRAHIEFHEEERNGFHNVSLDAISAALPTVRSRSRPPAPTPTSRPG